MSAEERILVKKFKRKLFAFALAIFLPLTMVAPAYAAELQLTNAVQERFYVKLREAAFINTVTAMTKKCMKMMYNQNKLMLHLGYIASGGEYVGDEANYQGIVGEYAREGLIFSNYNLDEHGGLSSPTTALWFENHLSGDTLGRTGVNGGAECDEAELYEFMHYASNGAVTLDNYESEARKILCDQDDPKKGGLITPGHMNWDKNSMNFDSPDQPDFECNQFYENNDTSWGYVYWISGANMFLKDSTGEYNTFDHTPSLEFGMDVWQGRMQAIYENYIHSNRSSDMYDEDANPYIPEWSQIGHYNNVDGYFNYINDFNLRCSDVADVVDVSRKGEEGVRGVTIYDERDTEINAKRQYFYISESNNDSRRWEGALSEDNPVRSCGGLLERIEALRTKYNGEKSSLGDGRQYGYEGIMLEHFNNACETAVAIDPDTGERTGSTGLDAARAAWQAYKDQSEDADAQAEAQGWIDVIDRMKETGIYFTDDGEDKEETAHGRTYRCIEVEGLERQLEDYEPITEELVEEPAHDREDCYANAGPLGWVLCPAIAALQDFIIKKYSSWVEPALQIDATLFTTDGSNNGTYQAWSVFRDIGNFIFVVLFIFVIFSQISGIGIDNYGIKKALPKLIAIVVLVNLSFIICQVAIDVCNIAGRQIGGMFQSITKDVRYPSYIDIEGEIIKPKSAGGWSDTAQWGNVTSTILIILVAALGAAVVLSKGLAIVIPVLMAFISIGIAVLGLIVLLGMRQAASVLLVVASPIAIVCYALPNTKTIFDRWFKAFQGLLLAYPICSALVYGGDMAGTILVRANNGNTWVMLAAVAVTIAPIFIIPKVIKKSMSAIAGIVTGAGKKTAGFLQGKAKDPLERSRLVHGYNYRQQLRQQKHQASATKYGAERGRRLLASKRYQNPGSLKGGKRNAYNVAVAAVNADNADAENAYTSQFRNQQDGEIMSTINHGKLDANKIVAGINSMEHDSNVTDLLRSISGTKEFEDMLKNDPTARSRIAQALASRRGSIVNQSIGKLMAKGQTDVEEMFKDGSLREKVQSAGAGVMKSQNKDLFNTRGITSLLSDEQWRGGLTAGYTGDTAVAFHDAMGQLRSEDTDGKHMENIIGGMTAEDISRLNTTTVNGREVGSLDALGGAAAIFAHNADGVAELKSIDGRDLRAGMDAGVKAALGITDDEEAAAGGGSGGGLTSGIKDEDKSSDDKSYEAWIDAHGESEGDIDISHSHPTAPDLSSIEDTGTRRDASGRVIGHRAKEGTTFEYRSRLSGETSEEYGKRIKYENAVAEWAAKQPPKRADETGEQYRARMKVPKSQAEWEAGGGGKIL